jgi:peptidoglycan L-alanyl-D-glutamate endopeptidase CwlK
MPTLSQTSLRNLSGVNPKLILFVNEAITQSPIDFRVVEGLRNLSRQKHLLSIGASQTLDSRHLTGDAVDLVPWDGGPRWEWPLYYTLVTHLREIAKSLGIPLRWGGAWDLSNFIKTVSSIETLVSDYVARQRAKGKKAFLDGPHFELLQKDRQL